MGWFKKEGGSNSKSQGSNSRSRYVSPADLAIVPSDLSKNKVPTNNGTPMNRPAPGTTLRALPTSPERVSASNNNSNFFASEKESSPSPADEVIAASSSESQTSGGDEEMVIVHPRGKGHNEKRDDEVSDVGRVDTHDDLYSEVDYKTQSAGHTNSLFNGHLMKWKFDAEEGPGWIRVPAFLGGLGLLSTTTTALVLYPETWTISSIVISVFVYIIAITTLILDGRFLSSSPLSFRAHLRNVITRHFGIFRYLWGRGLLYLAGAVLSAALMIHMTMISGAVMLLISILAISIGSYSSRKFSSLRHSLSDESFLLLEFSNVDYDDDGYINPSEFAHLLNSLGMELDDRYTLKAFNSMDTDHDRKISFEEFCHWWSQGYIERGRKSVTDGDEESYHRFV